MLRDCENKIKNDAATTRSNNHKWLYSSAVSNAFAVGSAFMQQFLLKCLSWRLLSCIAVCGKDLYAVCEEIVWGRSFWF